MIYLLEDDDSIRKLVLYALETQGFEAQGFSEPVQFHLAMKKHQPQLILLDLMLPGEDGITILQQLRQNGSQVPVIILTARNSEYDRVEGLDAGADDYISKPFGIMELMARIRAVLRRSQQTPNNTVFQYENLRVSSTGHQVMIGEREVVLTNKEFLLLELLIRNQGRVLTRETLLESVWGLGSEPENRTLDVHIRTLRAKLQEAGSYIQTVRGIGYRFKGENV